MANNANINSGKRLQRAREKAGFSEATEAARALGIKIPTYLAYENGNRGFANHAAALAKRFKVNVDWLLTGNGPMDRKERLAPLVGFVGAGFEVIPIDDHELGAGLEEIEIPPGVPDDAVLVEVRGDSMYPRLRDGERLFYIKQERNPSELVGLECIVKLPDGRMFVKDLERGQDGTFDLLSHNAPPMRNQRLEWAAPVMARVNRGVGRR